ncbi:LOW QUALITY PROTEIN: zinc finger protein 62 homolog [Apis laboriosa]|uniref:LOW QUALITY PROTEIN: zinc finger protein 62 homolog n=1 Tax=Apis laboriosa TaxID=183418 RepID=UPI001CC730AB|nr:LOW QUALITY PROTEIN: zinc finger protein 62 homolog [Apis laboriosa]
MRKLVEHLKNLHNIDRAFSCDECGKTFRSPMNIAQVESRESSSATHQRLLVQVRPVSERILPEDRVRGARERAHEKGDLSMRPLHENLSVQEESDPSHEDPPREYFTGRDEKWRETETRVHDLPGRFHAETIVGNPFEAIARVARENGASVRSLRRYAVLQKKADGAQAASRQREDRECDVCDKQFASKENLSIHRRVHTGEKPYGCSQCGRRFAQRTSLILHLSNWSNEHDEFSSCEDFRIKNEDVLFDPEQKFEGNEKVCDLCQEKFHFVTRLVAHLRIVHGIHRPFKCATCEKTYPQQFMLNAHVKKSHTPKTIPCNQCSFMGVNATDVERHTKRHHREVKFTCEICSENFVDKDSLTTHTTMHNFMQFQQCNACGTTFNDVYSLKEHNRLYHYDPAALIQEKLVTDDPQTAEHKCDVCGKVYKYKSVLKQHKVKAHGDMPNYERRRYLCALCGKELKTAKGLEIHNRSHTGEKPYTCEVCGKCFACETLLRTHNVTHTGERKYSCDQCGKAFTQRSTLVVHKRYHTGERPYVCPRCGKGFVTRTVLNTHMKSCR